jgi:hypothetical protein
MVLADYLLRSSEPLVKFYQTTSCYIPEEGDRLYSKLFSELYLPTYPIKFLRINDTWNLAAKNQLFY